jgi:hypothetical protein
MPSDRCRRRMLLVRAVPCLIVKRNATRRCPSGERSCCDRACPVAHRLTVALESRKPARLRCREEIAHKRIFEEQEMSALGPTTLCARSIGTGLSAGLSQEGLPWRLAAPQRPVPGHVAGFPRVVRSPAHLGNGATTRTPLVAPRHRGARPG